MIRGKIFLLVACALMMSAHAQIQTRSFQSKAESVVSVLADN